MKFLKHTSTNFLRLALCLLGIIVLALCIFALPSAWRGGSAEFPLVSYSVMLIVSGLYLTAIPFFVALWQAWQLLAQIDRGQAFSEASVKRLKTIKHCALIISTIYIIFVPLLYPIAEFDDAPGLIIFGVVVACAPLTVTVFAALLEKLLQAALAIKSENDLTI